jgi:uncharacterized sporulation protein YeaH/YhbH (DUF444 family)
MLYLIDRRVNGRGKSALNRERFLRRYKEHIRGAVQRMVAKRSIKDMASSGDVSIPARDIAEPTFRHGAGGDREIVAPGNREFAKGDKLRRPEGGGAGGSGAGAGGGDSVDEFTFSLSREEFLNIFFEDLELPRLARTVLGKVERTKLERAGYTTEGAPCNLSVIRTLQSALGRRVALSGAIGSRMEELSAEADGDEADPERRAELEAELETLGARQARVPFLDSLDLRYRNRVLKPVPVARAVMFCLMDVSASMDENKKDLAKRFFTLLYLFLTQKYQQVELVFVRHTEHAEEVDEAVFFNNPGSGGTVVLSALELMHKIATERYPASTWNIYAAQASDGDAFGADGGGSARFLEESILPLTRYFAYVEVPDSTEARTSALWTAYDAIAHDGRFAMRRATRREEIYPVFRELFRKEA